VAAYCCIADKNKISALRVATMNKDGKIMDLKLHFSQKKILSKYWNRYSTTDYSFCAQKSLDHSKSHLLGGISIPCILVIISTR
jgi:hypothetical protein